ncbi:MAG: nucleotide sugar dehydrogenase [Gammaproteobacteria bacterium]|nr:nucleotide sugar dehydrogenase [Gammaproteobacteria bacterium]
MRRIAVIGLGYVGLPVAVAFGKHSRVIGFDINEQRLKELRNSHDRTGEVATAELSAAQILYTSDINDLRQADFLIIAVPTPVDEANKPDLGPVLRASASVGKALKRGDIVVYESTVYPGATEEDCAPLLEQQSGLKCGRDFFLGYSPERINPGDKQHTFTKIKKVVSGQTPEVLEIVAEVYGSVIEAGVHKASSIKVAEAAKVIENTQRDLNIALMNELALIFDRMGIDTQAVLEAAGTKWNFMPFKPGLVGGHCIGVDPYYLTHKAEKIGYIPQVILSGRRINDSMGRYIAQRTVKEMVRSGHAVLGATITVLGLTFKEDCPDLRNSGVVNILQELQEFGVRLQVSDPLADMDEAREEYGVELMAFKRLQPADALIIAVAHADFRKLSIDEIRGLMKDPPLVIDVKGIFMRDRLEAAGIRVWRL